MLVITQDNHQLARSITSPGGYAKTQTRFVAISSFPLRSGLFKDLIGIFVTSTSATVRPVLNYY